MFFWLGCLFGLPKKYYIGGSRLILDRGDVLTLVKQARRQFIRLPGPGLGVYCLGFRV